MKKPLQDDDIVFLLGELKDETPDYPADALERRRAAFQASATGLVAGIAAGGAVKGGLLHGILHGATTSELILSALIAVTLLIETTAGVYVYRARLLARMESGGTPTLSAIGPLLTPIKTNTRTPTPTSTPTATSSPTPTMTLTPTGSPPSYIIPGGNPPAGRTPTPTPSKTNPGLKIGHTPTPYGHRTERP